MRRSASLTLRHTASRSVARRMSRGRYRRTEETPSRRGSSTGTTTGSADALSEAGRGRREPGRSDTLPLASASRDSPSQSSSMSTTHAISSEAAPASGAGPRLRPLPASGPCVTPPSRSSAAGACAALWREKEVTTPQPKSSVPSRTRASRPGCMKGSAKRCWLTTPRIASLTSNSSLVAL